MRQFKAAPEIHHRYFEQISRHLSDTASFCETCFLDLGVRTVRVVSYAEGFKPLMERQLTWSLRSSAQDWDVTIVLWCDPEMSRKYGESVQGFDLNIRQVLSVNETPGIFWGFDAISDTYYYSAHDLSPEEFIKQGHLLVKIFYQILKTPSSNLVHGAVVGVDGKGVLFCARGQRGKSTLAVLAMLKGFDYVSDDYLVLSREGEGLYTYPIYSIITLSPTMYNELYDDLAGTRFVSNNARGDKYVINIANRHDRFRTSYPVVACLFPEIVSDPEPSIISFDRAGRGRAITQLAHSTMTQMCELHDTVTTRKLMDMVGGQPFYQIRLCRDLHKNVELLRKFITEL